MGQSMMVAAACAWPATAIPNAPARQTGLKNGFINTLPLLP
jgi:hypothetical protein